MLTLEAPQHGGTAAVTVTGGTEGAEQLHGNPGGRGKEPVILQSGREALGGPKAPQPLGLGAPPG